MPNPIFLAIGVEMFAVGIVPPTHRLHADRIAGKFLKRINEILASFIHMVGSPA